MRPATRGSPSARRASRRRSRASSSTLLIPNAKSDIPGTVAKIKAYFAAHKGTDALLGLDPDVTVPAIAAAPAGTKIGTFDLNGDVITNLESGKMLFAIDQQQYLQGYLPVVFSVLFVTNLNTVGGGKPVLTGPGIVNKANAAQGRGAREGGHEVGAMVPAGRPAAARPAPRAMSETTAPSPQTNASCGGTSLRGWLRGPTSAPSSPRSPSSALFSIFAHQAGWLGWADAAQWTDQSAQYGIVAVPVALLMIGGEFDLSAGVMIGSSGLLLGLLGTRAHLNIWPSILLVLLFGAAVGLHQRRRRRQDEAAELHRHARDVLHPAGRQRRRDAEDHRHGLDREHRLDVRASPRRSTCSRRPSGRRTTSR